MSPAWRASCIAYRAPSSVEGVQLHCRAKLMTLSLGLTARQHVHKASLDVPALKAWLLVTSSSKLCRSFSSAVSTSKDSCRLSSSMTPSAQPREADPSHQLDHGAAAADVSNDAYVLSFALHTYLQQCQKVNLLESQSGFRWQWD